MWPVRPGRASSFLLYVSYILAVSAFLFWLGELGTVIRVRHDAKQLLGYVGLLCGHFVSLYKWCVLAVNRRQLQRLVDSLNKCMQTEAAAERSEELHRFTKVANTRATIMTVFWMAGAMYVTLYWSITPLLHNGSHEQLSGLHANETFRSDPYCACIGILQDESNTDRQSFLLQTVLLPAFRRMAVSEYEEFPGIRTAVHGLGHRQRHARLDTRLLWLLVLARHHLHQQPLRVPDSDTGTGGAVLGARGLHSSSRALT